MNKEEILEYNKRCAEFLGWKNINDESFPEYIDKLGNFYPLKKLVFDSDWNWIMEVVEAIQKIVIKNDDEFCIEFYEGLPNQPETFVSVGEIEVRKVNSKEAVVETINRFLILYEQNK